MFMNGPWKDDSSFAELEADVLAYSEEEVNKGSRFSVIYAFCGVTFALLGASNLCMIIGVWSLYARFAGMCLGCCFGCVNLAAIITTGVFRFNSMGKLAALSLTPS